MSQRFVAKDGMEESLTEANTHSEREGQKEKRKMLNKTESAQFELTLKNGCCCIVSDRNERG